MKSFWLAIVVVLAILWLIWIPLVFWSNNPHDDTDPSDGGHSGMILYTDHLFGCQYLGRPLFGGLTPRLGPDGHIVCKTAQIRE